MMSFWIAFDGIYGVLNFLEESISKFGATLTFVVIQCRPEIMADPLVENCKHGLSAKLGFDLIPRAMGGWVGLHFVDSPLGFIRAVILVGKNCWKRAEKFRCKHSPLIFGEVHCFMVDLDGGHHSSWLIHTFYLLLEQIQGLGVRC